MSKKEIESARPTRVPLHKSKGLDATQRPGFRRRFVNENRVDRFLSAGWVLVVGSENNTSDKRAQTESQLGSAVKKVVNRGLTAEAHLAYLMEIPEELYQEDMKAKMAEVQDIENSYDPSKRSQNGSEYGTLKKDYS